MLTCLFICLSTLLQLGFANSFRFWAFENLLSPFRCHPAYLTYSCAVQQIVSCYKGLYFQSIPGPSASLSDHCHLFQFLTNCLHHSEESINHTETRVMWPFLCLLIGKHPNLLPQRRPQNCLYGKYFCKVSLHGALKL